MSTYFRYSVELYADLQSALGADRFAPYLASRHGNVVDAVELYVWNSALAAAFLAPLGAIEVALRNALNAQLEATFTAPWYDDPAFLGLNATGTFARRTGAAKAYILRARPARAITTPRLVAELGIAFWVSLLKPVHNRTLWPILRPGLVRYTHRKSAMRQLEPLVVFRNRVAHHEPIYDRAPAEAYDRILAIADMLKPNLRSWIEHHSRVRALLAEGPVPAPVRF